MKKLIAVAGAFALSMVSLAGCSSDTSTREMPAQDQAQEQGVEMATIIDVRTPEEFQEGHLEGALNIDIQDPGFAAAIDELDPEGSYDIYCRSGNRAGQAIEYMKQKGFTNVRNLGSVEQASEELGVSVVK
ncbi:MAG: rhodanese-like domain-containing protein [Actinomycetaceae bacterium]|nr:rhodanese-like domain-containing protein [Actinomycetaceae bacterium]